MTARRIITYSIFCLITTSNQPLAAQVFDMTLTTELQTDFQGGYNWVNLFRTDFQWAIARQILQPTLHMIHNNHERKAIGLLRLGYTL